MRSPWFPYRRPRKTAPRTRLVCLPYAGAVGNVYRTWGDALGPDVEVCSVELPGRGSRVHEPLAPSIDTTVRELAPAVEALGDEPLMLFGHSLGGLVAFELAQHLVAVGRDPRALVVSACPHPSAVAWRTAWHELPDDAFVEHLRRLGGTPPALFDRPEVLAVLLPILRADLRLFWTHPHRARPPLPTSLAVFAGSDDPYWDVRDLDGWRSEARDVSHHTFTGGHFFIQTRQAPVLETLLRIALGPRPRAAAAG